jgi:hypothetical protein
MTALYTHSYPKKVGTTMTMIVPSTKRPSKGTRKQIIGKGIKGTGSTLEPIFDDRL